MQLLAQTVFHYSYEITELNKAGVLKMNSRLFGLLASFIFFISGCILAAPAEQQPAVVQLPFDGNLLDCSGHGNDANAQSPLFVPGHKGQGLKTAKYSILIPDCTDLRLAPGLRIDFWMKFEVPDLDGVQVLAKESEYMLRVDPSSEGGCFAFFVYLDNWEPRARSKIVPKPGVWYHIIMGWDGRELFLEVNDDKVRVPRTGTPILKDEPLRIGPVDGVIDELRLENPGTRQSGVAHWSFDGNLGDDSGKGHDIIAKGVNFVPGRCGQALQSSAKLQVPSSQDLQLAPGFRIDCSVYFEQLPTDGRHIVIKDGEYQLRLDSQKDGGRFAFFVNLSGWEPRASSDERVKAGTWYRLIAKWDGFTVSLDVNGEKTQVSRSGLIQPAGKPLCIGATGGLIDDLRIENPRLPVFRVRGLTQEHTLLRAGRPEKLTALIQNIGQAVENAIVKIELQKGVTCLGKNIYELGTLPPASKTNVEWTVQADKEVCVWAGVQLTAGKYKPQILRCPLAFFSENEQSILPEPVLKGGPESLTHYIDSVEGNNANPGISPDAPWRDFTNINGKTLGAGEKLLIKRGSVINQELIISAAGTAEKWAEIGAYGTGPRPIIRRNWDIDDRCVLVSNPDFLLIRSLVVSYAAKGLVVHYQKGGHEGLVIDDCIAHHIEGLYRLNAHGIPEWRDRSGPTGDSLGSSAGFAIVGAQARNLVLKNSEMFQTSWGFFVAGEAVTVDRVFCHDNYVHNTSPHPAMVSTRRSFLQNSIFDAPGGHAFAGTMGIMLCDPQGLIIRNCIFCNQPDSGSHDEGGIDFENHGNGCLIDHCTFQNNAGAAIEVLGLKVPQPKNVEIMNSRFIKNNTARKLGPSEIYIWGKSPNPDVCCSTGFIHDNGYVTNSGVEFFVNEAPKTTNWELRNNTGYNTVEELEKAMPFNNPPVVNAGPDIITDSLTMRLTGKVSDDEKPGDGKLAVRWEVLEGPGPVSFRNATAPKTKAKFSVPGDYILRLVGDDGELWSSDMVAVHVLPEDVKVAAAWEFNSTLNKEGWTEVNPGTRVMEWMDHKWNSRSEPVKYVSGGYYILAIEDSPDAHLLSPDALAVDLKRNKTIRIRFQNHTPATKMRFKFITEADTAWDDGKSRTFDVVADDNVPRDYAVDMSAVPGWTGRLKQLRLDLATGATLTGTCRFDYIWIDNSKVGVPGER